MREILFAVTLAGVTFVSTSFDNLVILLGLFGHPGFRPRDVVAGYVGSVLLVAGVSAGAGAVSHLLPARNLQWLGLVPIGLGVLYGIRTVRGRTPGEVHVRRPRPGAGGLVATVLVTLASSADSFLVYSALFADTRTGLSPVILVTLGICAWAWTAVARRLVSRPLLRARATRVAGGVLPVILILVGLYILVDTPTDVVEHVESIVRSTRALTPI
jgi:cadmium resistance protein CadD (predicted permease)